MGKLEYYQNLDPHPFIGLRKFNPPIKAKIVDDEYTRHSLMERKMWDKWKMLLLGKHTKYVR